MADMHVKERRAALYEGSLTDSNRTRAFGASNDMNFMRPREQTAMHHLCLIGANLVYTRLKRVSDPSFHGVDDEDVKMLCVSCFVRHYSSLGVHVDDFVRGNDTLTRSSIPVTSRAAGSSMDSPLEELLPSDAVPSMAEEETQRREGLIDKLMRSEPPSLGAAIELFQQTMQRTLVTENVPAGEEFTADEIRFLCLVGACFETKYKPERRSSLVRVPSSSVDVKINCFAGLQTTVLGQHRASAICQPVRSNPLAKENKNDCGPYDQTVR